MIMSKFKMAKFKVLAVIAALIISAPAVAVNTQIPGFEDGVTRVAQSEAIMTEKTNYEGLPQWAVYRIDEQLYTLRFDHYQSFFLIASDGVIVSDPNNEPMAARMVQEIKKITDKPIKLVIYSHDHWDHTIGAQAFKDEGATILAHQTTIASMLRMNARRPTPEALIPDLSWHGDRYVVPLRNADLQLRYFGDNHGSGMVVYLFPKRQIIHLTDIISPNRLPAGPMPDMYPSEILRTLNEVAKLDFNQVISSHEPWVLFPRSAVDDMADFFADMFETVDQAIAQFGPGAVPWTVVAATKPNPKYDSWSMYKEWWYMVAGRFVIERLLGW
jgi:glyoxylase-like metal-dependent hydrolase (beta-lactamase superfamily II)